MDIPAKLVLTGRSGKGFATPRWYFFGLMAYLIIHPLVVSFYLYIVSLNHCCQDIEPEQQAVAEARAVNDEQA